jgi:hypothetical protein
MRKKMSSSLLLHELITYSEEKFTEEVLFPLIKELHPGNIEYTHSSIEAGRDIVSFGRDILGRQHVLCIQVKARPLSYGAKFHEVVGVSQLAKNEGVTLQNGSKCLPDEVWYITSHPFPEPYRRQVSDSLIELSRKNIKIIAGEEIASLLIDTLPDLAYKIMEVESSEIKAIISRLSIHSEGRAFDLPKDKYIDSFYIDIDICPSAEYVWDYLRKKIAVTDITKKITTRKSINYDKNKKRQIDILELDSNNVGLAKFLRKYSVSFSVRIVDAIEDIEGSEDEDGILDEKVAALIDIKILDTLTDMRREIKSKIIDCPRAITEDNSIVNSILYDFQKIRRILSFYLKETTTGFEKDTECDDLPRELRIKVNHPVDILSISDQLVIEGHAGHGKTTLLKMIAVALLESGEKALYIPCFVISDITESSDLMELIKINKWLVYPPEWEEKDIVLLLDGLDEAQEDLSSIILQNSSKFKKTIISTRFAYQTTLRNVFPTIALSTFSEDSRDQFFSKWFAGKPENIQIVKSLCSEYPAFDQNSRIPMLAIIIAVLIENGYKPTSRVELYEHRLDLLLWKWDQARGVKRNLFDNPEAKKRFLMELAFHLHKQKSRTATTKIMKEVFEKSLGQYGYKVEYDDFIKDLVVNNGILFKEINSSFSFGHLSFQEHLVGIYIYEKFAITNIVKHLTIDWWKEPMLFYAAYKKDITELIDFVITHSLVSCIPILQEMGELALFTSPGALAILKDSEYLNVLED